MKRDQFLNHLTNNLDIICKYSIVQIIWNDEMEVCLWGHPQIPPWRQDRDWYLQLFPMIYNKLTRLRYSFGSPGTQHSSIVYPTMNCANEKALSCFLKMMHEAMISLPAVILCLGLDNRLNPNSYYTFSCADCHLCLEPRVINDPNDWLNHLDLSNDYWPSHPGDTEKLASAMEIVRIRDFQSNPFLYSFSFSPSFITHIISSQVSRPVILKQIVRRLILTKQQAMQDRSLRDEYLSQSKEYRFRVTRSARIHYNYTGDRSIVLVDYYDKSRHDDAI